MNKIQIVKTIYETVPGALKMNDRDTSNTLASEQLLEITIPKQAILCNDLSPVIAPFHWLLAETRRRGVYPGLLHLNLSVSCQGGRPPAYRAEVQAWFYYLHCQHPALPFWLDALSIQLYLQAAMPGARHSKKAQMLHRAGLSLLDQGLTAVVMEVLGAGQLLCYEMFPRHQAITECLIAAAIGRIDAAMVAQFSYGLGLTTFRTEGSNARLV